MNRLTWSRLDETARRAALTRPVQTVAQQTRDAVAALIAQVRAQGDDAAVRRQQAWLAQHRGRAIAEVTALQVWQPLNVHDVSTWATPAATGAP
ncbi:hypothetical protein EN803_33720 [Mesorhizobium sp. M2D.F.Ca.ET.160.01.1.1]|nr:hypothetical protein EN803_33720 [Mesorhizobium sp. M2D.F.Ca.ET.160.01.1.1]